MHRAARQAFRLPSSCLSLLIAILLAGVPGCSEPPTRTIGKAGVSLLAAPWPEFDFPDAARRGDRVYRLTPEQSRIEIVVRRDGPLARFGHDHVVVVSGAEGFLLLGDDLADSRAEIRFPLERMQIDASEARARYELNSQPDEAAIRGTRRHLLEDVLQPQRWPYVHLRVDHFRTDPEGCSADVEFDIDGTKYGAREPFSLENANGSVSVAGSFFLAQSDLGLQPYSALGGGLKVADRLEVHFALRASFLQPSTP